MEPKMFTVLIKNKSISNSILMSPSRWNCSKTHKYQAKSDDIIWTISWSNSRKKFYSIGPAIKVNQCKLNLRDFSIILQVFSSGESPPECKLRKDKENVGFGAENQAAMRKIWSQNWQMCYMPWNITCIQQVRTRTTVGHACPPNSGLSLTIRLLLQEVSSFICRIY